MNINKISNTKQMKMYLIYFDDKRKPVKRCNILGLSIDNITTTTVKGMLQTCLVMKRKLDYIHYIVQILMNGPNVEGNCRQSCVA